MSRNEAVIEESSHFYSKITICLIWQNTEPLIMTQSNAINILDKTQVQKNLLSHLPFTESIIIKNNQKVFIMTFTETGQAVNIIKTINQIQSDNVRMMRAKFIWPSQPAFSQLNMQGPGQPPAAPTQPQAAPTNQAELQALKD